MDFRAYFNTRNLKKTPRVGIHFEQKTTPDLIWCVAQVILDLTKDDRDAVFSDADIRQSEVFNTLMQDYFSKPPQERAENEYNKVSSYQLGVLAYAGVLEEVGRRPKRYKIKELEVLEYLSINDLNAARFLIEYTQKFLSDNGLIDVFEQYKTDSNQANHLIAKEKYWEWAKDNTAIKGEDRRHTYRVFNKIFNIFCYANRIPGEDASNITEGPCPYSFLIYNRTNFRDENMPVGMTRQEYKEQVLTDINTEGVVETLLKKVKDTLKQKYNSESEIKDTDLGYAPNRVVEVHHILPKHSYPQFSLSRENLIVLTPDQHRSFAHNGNYRTINPEFQSVCLQTKLHNIQESVRLREDFYDFGEFVSVVNTCYKWSLESTISMEELETKLEEKVSELNS